MTPTEDPRPPETRGERAVGWYRDPEDPKTHRFWNGQRWSSSYTGGEPRRGEGPGDTTA